jgi:hypothetical protein
MMSRWTMTLALAAACAGGATTGTEPSACLEDFPAEDGFDFASDGSASVADLQAECADAGSSPCDVVVTRAAAECIADGEDVTDEGRTASLVYNVVYEAIVWNVQDTLTAGTTSYATSSGHGVTIHAGTGEVLAAYDWTASP